eukprot:TRINITY_DN211_c0_g1_i2.p1 TRINITY_DN211_c0_g1~~TRINITY_DN211_c0_g1_i2.p1  ORF type:complete len:335 (-),score=52.33 TRINITY_DN211_c0_g1_i2:111-1115(-)
MNRTVYEALHLAPEVCLRYAEIYDGEVHKIEDSFGSVGAGLIKTSYKVEEDEPEEEKPSTPVHRVKEGEEEEGAEQVTRDIGNLKVSYTVEDDVKPHRSTLQKIKEKITDKDKVKLDSQGQDPKPGLITKFKQKVWSSSGGEGKSAAGKQAADDAASSEIEASSGSDTSLFTDSPASENLVSTSGPREEELRQPRENSREEMATPTDAVSTLNDGALPSSELGTGYEEDSEGPRSQHPKESEDKPSAEAGTDETLPASSTAASRDELRDEIPPLDEVKAPGIMDRIKEEVSAMGDTVWDSTGQKDDSETGVLGRFARRIGLEGSDASHGRSHST